MSVERDVTEGFAALLKAADPTLFYDMNNVPAPTDTLLTIGTMPDSPDRCIVLNFTPMTDNPSIPLGLVMVQAACRGGRGDPLSAGDIGDFVFDSVHGVIDRMFGSSHVIQILRNASIPMGQDDVKRTIRADRYFIDLDYPPTTLRPVGGTY